jgi:tetratricopeptide (TPR) repeat protein
MTRRMIPILILILLLAAAVSLATLLQPRAAGWNRRAQSGNMLTVLLGDGRRLFANHFFVKADVYFHSGYYPSIFDQAQAPKDSHHMTAEEGSAAEEAHEKAMNFLGKPRDWVERFGRHFLVTEHTHLTGTNEREILPWLKLSADLDPQKVETYTVAAYWLRNMGKVVEAEQFLRRGMRANPDSYEILFELGRVYYENEHDAARARNVWELALRKWNAREAGKKDPDMLGLEQIAVNLAHLEEKENHLPRAIELLQLAQKASPVPQMLQKQIDELKARSSAVPQAHP